MKSRQILITILILATMWHTAAAQPKKNKSLAEPPPLERVLAETNYPPSNTVLSDLTAVKAEMPLGPQDILKAYEIAMSVVANKTSSEFAMVVQAQQANQITREEAEYLLQQTYQMAMMQYQVLSALHDVLKHDMDEATLQSKRSLKAAGSDEVLVVAPPFSPSGSR